MIFLNSDHVPLLCQMLQQPPTFTKNETETVVCDLQGSTRFGPVLIIPFQGFSARGDLAILGVFWLSHWEWEEATGI